MQTAGLNLLIPDKTDTERVKPKGSWDRMTENEHIGSELDKAEI